MKKKLLFLLLLIGTMIAPLYLTQAATCGLREGEIYTYHFNCVHDEIGGDITTDYYYTQDLAMHSATTGDYWEWEIVTITTTEITGIFRAAGAYPLTSDWICRSTFDNLDFSFLPVTPFFFDQDWAAQGASSGFTTHNPSAPEYFYQYDNGVSEFWDMFVTIDTGGLAPLSTGYLYDVLVDNPVYGLSPEIYFVLVDYTAPADNPNYDPSGTTTTVPYTGTPTTTTPDSGDDSGDGFGGVLDDFGDALSGVLGILGIEATGEAAIFLFLLILILLLLGYLIYQSRKRQRKITPTRHPVIRRSKNTYKNFQKRLGLK